MGTLAWWFAPVVTGILWILGGTMQLRAGLRLGPAPRALMLFTLGMAGFALGEGLYLQAPSASEATLWYRLRLSSIVLAVPWLPIWGKWLLGHASRRDLILLTPAPPLVLVVWVLGVVDVKEVPWGFEPIPSPWEQVAVWSYSLACVILSARYLRLNLSSIRAGGTGMMLGGRVFLVTSLIVFVVAGVYSFMNNYFGLVQPPIAGVLLMFPAAVLVLFNGPLDEEALGRITERMAEGAPEVLEAHLVGSTGELLASRLRHPGRDESGSALPAVLDTISQVMGTAFPSGQGDLVRALHHGDIRVLVEKGREHYLALVVRGKENETIREEMRYLLRRIEEIEGGVPQVARGSKEALEKLLQPLFQEPEVF